MYDGEHATCYVKHVVLEASRNAISQFLRNCLLYFSVNTVLFFVTKANARKFSK